MMKKTFEQIAEEIISKETGIATIIYNIKLKDYDDDEGSIGEHYIVEYELCEMKQRKKQCLILKSYFDEIRNKKENIIFL